MLVVVVLWATVPAFACLLPAQYHACCRQMTQDCAATMDAEASCCQVHSPQTDFPPAASSASGQQIQLAPASLSAAVLIPADSHGTPPQAAEAPPPLTRASISILRI